MSFGSREEEVMNEWNRIRLKMDSDRETVARVLVMNGYTVRVRTVKEEGKKAVKMLEYRDESRID